MFDHRSLCCTRRVAGHEKLAIRYRFPAAAPAHAGRFRTNDLWDHFEFANGVHDLRAGLIRVLNVVFGGPDAGE